MIRRLASIHEPSILSTAGGRPAVVLLFGAVLLTAALPAGASHNSAPWFDNECSAGEYVRCWQPIPSANNPVRDKTAAQGDASKATTPNPSSADIWSGSNNTLNSVFFGYDDRGTASQDDDAMYFRMRLLDTPGIGGVPGAQDDGPYDANTTWNFMLDLNGDGWVDFVNTTDGKSGKNTDPYDDMFLGRNTSTSQQNLSNLSLCTSGGQVLWKHDSIDPANDSCASNTAVPCDFKHTRIVSDTANGGGYFLDMQFPLYVFDTCSGSDTDGDGIGGAQLLTATTPFTFCATTSTQPQDPSNKDLGANGTYDMSNSRRIPCGDNCSLVGGCSQAPDLVDLTRTCGAGANASPITLTASVMDTLVSNANGTSVVDTISNVTFYYRQVTNPNWTQAVAAPGSANPVVSPGSQPNLWSLQWNTSSLPTSPTADYLIRVDITDDEGNVTSEVPLRLNLASCTLTTTPVTLSSFRSVRRGDIVRFEWSTETETGNVGFNLYGETPSGWRRLNREPVPSLRVDSVEPLDYALEVPAGSLAGREVYLEDVDVRGGTRLHGPFGLGQEQGHRTRAEEVDWAAIRAQHEQRKADRAHAESARRGARRAAAAGSAAAAPVQVDLSVSQDGIYRLTYEALAAAGFDLAGVPLGDLALLNRDSPVPLHVAGNGHTFGPGAWVEFYGQALDTLYTDTNVYRLTMDRGRALRVHSERRSLEKGKAPAAWYLETRTVERNLGYSFAAPNGDPWYDTSLLTFTAPREWSFDLPVDGYVDGAVPPTVSVSMWGVTNWPKDLDHHVQVRLNGYSLADERFDGLANHPVSAQLPAGLLRDGANTLTLRLPGDAGGAYDMVNLESYAVTYPRAFAARDGRLTFRSAEGVFRVTGLTGPEVVVYSLDSGRVARIERVEVTAENGSWTATFPGTGKGESTYAVASAGALRVPGIAAARDGSGLLSGAAQYLVISHPDFLDRLQPLVAERQAQGLTVRVVDVRDVYSRFSGGIFDPQAIRGFIAYAARNLGTEYVLLVGGDTYDYRDYLRRGSISFLPSLYASTGPLVAFAPADPLYADVDGDNLVDLAIGRFPVRTAAELDSLISKTLDYARKGYDRTALFAADKFDASANIAFSEVSDQVIGRMPEGWSVRTAYVDALGVAGARGALLGAVNQGVALTSFFGHSGPTVWTFSNLFHANDAAVLTNSGRPTLVVQWGCWNTYYVSPAYNTMSHKLLLSGDRGAAAVLGATTLIQVESDLALGLRLSPRLVERGTTIGKAILAAKRELAATQPGLADVLLGWTVLGDPALSVQP